MMSGVFTSLAGVGFASFLIFYRDRAKHQVVFVNSGFIAASFMYSQLHYSFDPAMKLFSVVVLGAVVAIGALIGGLMGILLPKISTGVELGISIATLIGTLIYLVSNIPPLVLVGLYVCSLGASVVAAQRHEVISSNLRTCIVSGLILALSVDATLGYKMLTLVSDVLGGTSSHRETYDQCNESCYGGFLVLLWFLVSSGAFLNWAMKNSTLFAFNKQDRQGYAAVNPAESLRQAAQNSGKGGVMKPQQRTFSYPDTLEFNYYDPDNMHDLLTPYADLVFSTVQNCAKLYGFQVDSSRNQAEHLIMMLANETEPKDTKLNDPPQRLHNRMFQNYQKWCDRMGTPPLFIKPTNGRRYVGYIKDMLLYLLVWGESGNLRHMPECLCFLFHKTLGQYEYRKENSGWRSTYPGYFLDMAVTPMYEAVVAGMKRGRDHTDKLNYDDFNEFFWDPDCLKYKILDDEADISESMEGGVADGGGGVKGYSSLSQLDEDGNPVSLGEHVSRGLAQASKTYLEKRSWFHPMLAVHRILEWHVVAFTLLASIAFSVELQWNWSFTFQVGSVVFILISVMSILWTALEVWTQFPGTNIPGTSIFGYLLRLAVGYLVLVYQAVYYHWSFRPDGSPVLPGATSSWSSHYDSKGHLVTGTDSGANFWWWQYFWLSLFASGLYLVQSFMCWWPGAVTSLMTWNNDFFQALLNICWPLSQQYTAKKVNGNQANTWYYLCYWFTLLTFKLGFGYRFVVAPVAVPTLFLYDDYMNFNSANFGQTCLLMVMWWFPHFLVFIIDLSIFYSLWSSVVGAYVALVERQGAVRDAETFRAHFMRSPVAFCQKIMPADSYVSVQGTLKGSLSTSSITNIMKMSKTLTEDEMRQRKEAAAKSALTKSKAKSKSSADLLHFEEGLPIQGTRPTKKGATQEGGAHNKDLDAPRTSMAEFLDARSMRWVVFGRVWNEIIVKLRQTDHLSNDERDIFLFASFDGFLKPIYLPLYQTAGCITAAVHAFCETAQEFNSQADPQQKMLTMERMVGQVDVTTSEALSEVFELVSFVLKRLWGPTHRKDMDVVVEILTAILFSPHEAFTRLDAGKVKPIMNSITQIMSILKGCVGRRSKSPVYNSEAVLKQQQQEQQREASAPGSAQPHARPTNIKGSAVGMRKSVSTGFLQQLQPSTSADGAAGKVPDRGGKDDRDGGRLAMMTPYRSEVALVDQPRDRLRDQLKTLFTSLRGAMKGNDAFGEGQELKDRVTFMLSLENGFMWSDAYASKSIDELSKVPGIGEILFRCVGLLKLRQTEVDPKSTEATRRMHFFINSLFMDMPSVPTTRYSREYTCMTPFYSEDVLLTKDDLLSKNSDGISTLLYLQTLYRGDWDNFVERNGLSDDADGQAIWSPGKLLETRMWASYRAQTLFRTVEGMMYTEAALRLIAELEQIIPEETAVLAPLKFTYVVAAQVYGNQKKAMDTKADDIEFLLLRHPNLRVAYIDSVRRRRHDENLFYSVLIKHDPHAVERNLPPALQANHRKGGYSGLSLKAKEVYRVKLPGNPVIGEGKPENQNHAIIFSRGRYVQAMDMNQDGYFEESLKMRNMLQEFDSSCRIVGFREHIFTGSVSSVANYMACQELSFVTLGQRVLTNPLSVRQHYGHPDFFDKFFVMTEGGMSKASKGINLSEDVFAGYNATIRGHGVKFKEYAQVGKGRDVGLQQTYKFEAKLSQGNAEQTLSRDLSRVCDRLDFFRLLSFYYGGIGHYIANATVMFALVTVVYCMLALALFDQEGINGRKMPVLGQLQLVLAGMGILQTAPLFVTLTVETGIINACAQIMYMMLSGGPLYFIFHIQTKAYYFCQTLLAGGAMYRPTGRGFVTRHSPFDENFRFFASSHLYLGFDLMCALLLLAMYTTSTQYLGLTWSLWLATISFIIGPFWFNPITFEWSKLSEDYIKWSNWMSEVGGNAEQAWDTWWREENAFYNRLTPSWKLMQFCQKSLLWGAVASGLLGWEFLSDTQGQLRVAELVVLISLYSVLGWVLKKLERALPYALRRVLTLTLSLAFFAALATMVISHADYVRYVVAMYYIAAAFSFMLLLCGMQQIQAVYKVHDLVIGNTIFFVLAVLSALQVGYLQTWLLYHNALSAGVAIEDVLKYARKTKERGGSAAGDTQEMVEQLRRQLTEQEKLLRSLMSGKPAAAADTALPGYGAISSSDPIAGIQLSDRVGARVLDSKSGGPKMTPAQPIGVPPAPPAAHAPLSTSTVGSLSKPISVPVPPSSSSSASSRDGERTPSGDGLGLGDKKVRQSSADSQGSNGRLKSSDKEGSNASLASDSSFDASFNAETRPAPKDFSFSQPSALPPRS